MLLPFLSRGTRASSDREKPNSCPKHDSAQPASHSAGAGAGAAALTSMPWFASFWTLVRPEISSFELRGVGGVASDAFGVYTLPAAFPLFYLGKESSVLSPQLLEP